MINIKLIKMLLKVITIFLITFNTLANDSKISKYTNILGKPNAPNVLIEYASLSCVHCANFHNKKLPSIKKELIDSGKLKYIYVDFPLDLPAMLASMITHCYSEKRYFAVLESLYRNQKKWVTSSDTKEKLFESFHLVLKEYGVTLEKIQECTADTEENKKKCDNILASRLEGQNLGVNSTPTFFLNGKKLDGNIDLSKIKKLIY